VFHVVCSLLAPPPQGWRLFQLQKSLADPRHPFHKFGSGNINTLRSRPEEGVDTREVRQPFYMVLEYSVRLGAADRNLGHIPRLCMHSSEGKVSTSVPRYHLTPLRLGPPQSLVKFHTTYYSADIMKIAARGARDAAYKPRSAYV
jgi:hypothetical protein